MRKKGGLRRTDTRDMLTSPLNTTGRLIGDEVNLASRLEGMCKHYGVEILISGEMYSRVKADFLARPVDRVVAVGKTNATDIYELVAERAGAAPPLLLRCLDFAAVVAAYRERDFSCALGLATAFEVEHGPDPVAAVYIERCKQLLVDPPLPDWDFVVVLTSK